MDNDKLKKYRITGTVHPKWRWAGESVDLREIDDNTAKRLHAQGFSYVEPVPKAKKSGVEQSGS